MRILFATDAWHPQLNGVVRTIEETCAELRRRGHETEVIAPDRFKTIALPTYPDIRLALPSRSRLAEMIENFAPDLVHIATEGPLGWAARGWCLRRAKKFTTAYHSRFPEYLAARAPVPLALSYAVLRRFHNAAEAVLVPTPSVMSDLAKHGFQKLALWTRGVDTDLFCIRPEDFADLPRPILLYAGRIAPEKNLEAFLAADVAGTKIIVGEGPQKEALQLAYPAAYFTGRLDGAALAKAYAAADVFVFPSLTDTFGLVLVEALACGTPVAAFDVAGPRDVLAAQDAARPVGVLHPNLETAIRQCLELKIDAQACRDFVLKNYTWGQATDQFIALQGGLS